jgi:transposase InsO family protein
MIQMLVEEAVGKGARLAKACDVLGLNVRTLQRWVHSDEDGRHGPNHEPANKLSSGERKAIIETATNPEFRDMSPKQIVPLLADRDVYLGSESTFYRVLYEAALQLERRNQRPAVSRPSEHVADGPWQVASWDITFLRSYVRGEFFFLYLVEDIWSRKILGWDVHETQQDELSAELIERIRAEAPDQDLSGWVLHSDNGGPMKGATMLATLQRLGVVPSFSRPGVSDDNPFSESLFHTLKYCPEYPRDGFATLELARAWVARFVDWYNNEHQHSGIGYVAPAVRHSGEDIALLERRRAVFERARRAHPERWSREPRQWARPKTVTLNPKGRENSAIGT